MAKLSTQERQDLQGFLDDDLLEFVMDERTPTTSYAASGAILSPALTELIEKELDELFSKAFEQHEQQCSSDKISTISAKRPGPYKASVARNFGKPVSSKDISETVQKATLHKTQQDSKYCANIWNEWVIHRAKQLE